MAKIEWKLTRMFLWINRFLFLVTIYLWGSQALQNGCKWFGGNVPVFTWCLHPDKRPILRCSLGLSMPISKCPWKTWCWHIHIPPSWFALLKVTGWVDWRLVWQRISAIFSPPPIDGIFRDLVVDSGLWIGKKKWCHFYQSHGHSQTKSNLIFMVSISVFLDRIAISIKYHYENNWK